jgi:ribosome-associated protein
MISIRSVLDKDKAEEIVEIDLNGKTSFTDFMIIASASNARLVKAISSHLVEELKKLGINPQVEGYEQSDWVLIDAGDVIINILRPEVRDFYKIEKIWSSYSIDKNSEQLPVLSS